MQSADAIVVRTRMLAIAAELPEAWLKSNERTMDGNLIDQILAVDSPFDDAFDGLRGLAVETVAKLAEESNVLRCHHVADELVRRLVQPFDEVGAVCRVRRMRPRRKRATNSGLPPFGLGSVLISEWCSHVDLTQPVAPQCGMNAPYHCTRLQWLTT